MQFRLFSAGALALTFALTPCSLQIASAAPPATGISPARISDFTLADQNGRPHELYALKDAKAVVLIWQGVGCPIVQQMTPAIKDAAAKYEPKGVRFLMINSNLQDKPDMIRKEAESFGIAIPVLKDADQKVGLGLGVKRTAEVVVVVPKQDWRVVYHGPLDDRLTYGRARAKADNNWATDVLDRVLVGKEVSYMLRPADGCIISFPARDHQG